MDPSERSKRFALYVAVGLAGLLAAALACACGELPLPQRSPQPTATAPSTTAAPLSARWTRLNLYDGTINTLLVDDASPARTLYAGTDGGVFKSSDHGVTWVACNEGMDERLVRSLVLDPRSPGRLYAGSWDGHVHVSEDGGNNWFDRSGGLPPYEVRALAVDPYHPNELYAGLTRGVFTTTNGGQQWFPAGDFTGTLQCLAMNPEEPNELYVGTSADGVFKSTDRGATWFLLRNTGFASVSALAMVPRTPSTVYAISQGKVYRTKNKGVLWTYVDSYRDPAVARCLAVNPKDAREVYVGLQDGLYKSSDARLTWAREDTGLTPADVHILVVDPIETRTLYACSDTRLYVSTDAGITWQWRSRIQGDTAASIQALQGDPKQGNVFYASAYGGGLYKTADRGEHWQHVGEDLPISSITAIAVEPIHTQTIYLGSEQGFVFRSADGGQTWLPAGGVTESAISSLAVDPQRPQRLYAGTSSRGLFRSEDAGTHWSYKGGDIGPNVQRVTIDPRGPQSQVYALTNKGVFRSQDGGESWSPYLSPVADVAVAVKGSSAPIALGQPGGSTVTGQGMGESVTVVPSARVAAGAELRALTASPAMPQTVFVLVDRQGVSRSTDLGVTWAPLGSGLEARTLRVLALSPDDPDLILVGTDRGVYRYSPMSP
jgi:photosystem II stability/assembly factor-like uncharacterized protein